MKKQRTGFNCIILGLQVTLGKLSLVDNVEGDVEEIVTLNAGSDLLAREHRANSCSTPAVNVTAIVQELRRGRMRRRREEGG